MTTAILYGAGSGALHAVTGPDHVLSLGPVVLRYPRRSFRIGLHWGAGHALGTLLLAVPLFLLSRFVQLQVFAEWGERAAGVALLMAAGISAWSARKTARDAAVDVRGPALVGFIHGATGAGSLLLLLPVLVAGSWLQTLLFLSAFSVGSTLAMAVLTASIAQLGARFEQRTIARFQAVMVVGAGALGLSWIF